MTIAGAFNEIVIAHGGTPSKSGTIVGAINALNDVLAGEDVPAACTIEGAVRLLGRHIDTGGGGGGGIDVGELVDLYATASEPTVGGSAEEAIGMPFPISGVSLGDTAIIDLNFSSDSYVAGLRAASGAIVKSGLFGGDYGDADFVGVYLFTVASGEVATVEKLSTTATKENVTVGGDTFYRFVFEVPEVPDGKYAVVYFEAGK